MLDCEARKGMSRELWKKNEWMKKWENVRTWRHKWVSEKWTWQTKVALVDIFLWWRDTLNVLLITFLNDKWKRCEDFKSH